MYVDAQNTLVIKSKIAKSNEYQQAVGKIKGAEMATSTKLSLHPMLWIVVLAVVLFCAAATAAIG